MGKSAVCCLAAAMADAIARLGSPPMRAAAPSTMRTAPLADEVHRHVIEVAIPVSRLDDEVTVVAVRAESVRHQLWRRSPLRQVVADAEDRDSTGSDALVEAS